MSLPLRTSTMPRRIPWGFLLFVAALGNKACFQCPGSCDRALVDPKILAMTREGELPAYSPGATEATSFPHGKGAPDAIRLHIAEQQVQFVYYRSSGTVIEEWKVVDGPYGHSKW